MMRSERLSSSNQPLDQRGIDSDVVRSVGSEKIRSRHLERRAVVYLRQSTVQQMIRHQESTQVQYNLRFRAHQLGWSEDSIEVIDDDLGHSGASAEDRAGFQRLVAEVSLDHVGIIFGVEMSRLARSCKDWYQLLEACALFGTLIADLDGVYDPSGYNDRLLLGLKGTMSEAELHILKQRMLQGKLNKARRGELLFNLPIGYVRRLNGEVDLDSDEQVQAVVRIVFEKFEELGTLNSVLGYLVRHQIQMGVRVNSGLRKGELEWRRPNRMTLHNMLKNPMYAGVYVYGRRKVDPRRKVAGRPGTGRRVVPPEKCEVFLKDRFPAYISWEEFERNQNRLRSNRSVSEAMGSVRAGASLLVGLLVCKKCGGRMSVHYFGSGYNHRYVCNRMRSDYGEDSCQSLSGPSLDDFISEQVLEVLKPASLELSLEAAQHIEQERERLDTLWQKRLERAGYACERAARQYRLVEPENRLVARQLEREWEEKLREHKKLEEEYQRFQSSQPRVLSESEREAIRQLASDIPALWNDSQTSVMERKEILRQVVDRIVIDVLGKTERVRVDVHWAGGMISNMEMIRPVARLEQMSYYPQLVECVKQLSGQGFKAAYIAEQLNQKGWRPPKRGDKFNARGVLRLMNRLELSKRSSHSQASGKLDQDEWWVSELAQQLDMPPVTLYQWVYRGWVKARRDEGNRWVLWADPQEIDRLHRLRAQPLGHQTRSHWVKKTNLNGLGGAN